MQLIDELEELSQSEFAAVEKAFRGWMSTVHLAEVEDGEGHGVVDYCDTEWYRATWGDALGTWVEVGSDLNRWREAVKTECHHRPYKSDYVE